MRVNKLTPAILVALILSPSTPSALAKDIDVSTEDDGFSLSGSDFSDLNLEELHESQDSITSETVLESKVSSAFNAIERLISSEDTSAYDDTNPRLTENGSRGSNREFAPGGAISGASCITNDGKGKGGKMVSIPLPGVGDVEGTGSFNTADVGNFGCIPEDAPADEPVVVTDTKTGKKTKVKQITVKVTTKDFENQPIQPSKLHLDRAPHSLKNYNTNIYADSNTQTFTDTIMGRQVEIKAIPISYSFTYGDGTTLTTSNPGGSVGDRWDVETPTSHIYKDTGNYDYSVTTEYRGEWRIPGGPWQVIPGTAQRTSPAETVQVWKVKAHNVDQNCIENPTGPGCPS